MNIPKSKGYITLQGSGKESTSIDYNENAASAGSTYDSATVAVFSDYFVARDISFKVKFSSHLVLHLFLAEFMSLRGYKINVNMQRHETLH